MRDKGKTYWIEVILKKKYDKNIFVIFIFVDVLLEI